MHYSQEHAKDFFNLKVKDGAFNSSRGLNQYHNKSVSKPKVNDLIIFSDTIFNIFGFLAIISKETTDQIEIVQQNAGSATNQGEAFPLIKKNSKWALDNYRILGRLRKEKKG